MDRARDVTADVAAGSSRSEFEWSTAPAGVCPTLATLGAPDAVGLALTLVGTAILLVATRPRRF